MTKRGEIKLRGVPYKYAGGLEEKLLLEFDAKLPKGERIDYEPGVINFEQPAAKRWYKPDWLLKNGIIVEGKGEFTSKERKKFAAVKATYPDLDIRFIFSNENRKIGKKSQTTYAMWCDRFGFGYTSKSLPQAWVDEAPEPKRIAAAKAAIKRK